MTTQISSKDRFLGFPATKLKTLLLSWEKGNTEPDDLARLKSLGMSVGACAAFIGESFDRSYIHIAPPQMYMSGPSEFRTLELSNAGAAIASASARKRSSKEKAAGVLNDILDNVEKLAKDKHAPEKVDEVWVFGSFIDENKDDVGDLDIVITSSRTACVQGMHMFEENKYIDEKYPGVVPASTQYFRHAELWRDRMIYGSRRNALVAPNSLYILVGMHCPCRLVYSSALGGRISPLDFEHHPDSVERSDSIKDRLVMPDLETLPDDFEFTTAAVYMFPKEIDENAPAVIGAKSLTDKEWRSLEGRSLDGRDGLAVVIEVDGKRAVFHVAREIDFSDESQWNYKMTVEAICVGRGFDANDWQNHICMKMVESLFSADILRLADRREKLGVFPAVTSTIDFSCDSKILSPVGQHLLENILRCINEEYGTLLPCEEYRHSINILWGDTIIDGYDTLDMYDNDDWVTSNISREAYEAWKDEVLPSEISALRI